MWMDKALRPQNAHYIVIHIHKISNVTLETAGKLDMDVEIKFRLGDAQFDIDVQKDQIEKLKDLYKALLRI